MSDNTQFNRLVEIMSILRDENGCPWDRAQTHRSLRPYLLEETYEVLDKIDSGQYDQLVDELGDVMLQIVFHAQLAKENKLFTITDVLEHINEKLIRRHPHIFSDGKASTPEEVKHKWEEIKLDEGKKSVLDGAPTAQPALNRAFRVQEKAAGVGFEWTDIKGVWKKLNEELQELANVADDGDKEDIEDEIGDILFSMVNLSRYLGVNPEDALRGTIKKFVRRFQFVESKMQESGAPMNQGNLNQMDAFWNDAKKLGM